MNTATEHESFDLMKMDRKIQARTRHRRVLKLAGWGALFAVGLKRGHWFGLLVAGYALQGAIRTLAAEREMWERPAWKVAPKKTLRPLTSKEAKGLGDPVDAASRESFPASDPPGHGASS